MRRLLALASLLLCGACATMVNGTTQTLSVDSYPSRANVAVDCGDAARDGGLTPVSVVVPRRAPHCVLTLSREGYEPKQIVLAQQQSRAVAVNAALGVPVGLVVGLVGVIAGDRVDAAGELGGAGFEGGVALGSAPARQLDKHTGGAYKWVPGRLFVTLVRKDAE